MDIKKSIRVACAMKDINTAECAELCGIDRTQLSTLMRRKTCNIATLYKIATGMGYKVSEFIALGEEEKAA